jgi:hypothetical protein
MLKILEFRWTLCNIFVTTLTHISQSLKLFGFVCYITSYFLTADTFSILYTTLVRPTLEYQNICCLETHYNDGFVQTRKSLKKICCLVLQHIFLFCSNYECVLTRLNLSTLNSRRRHLHALFLINVLKNSSSSICSCQCACT